MAKVKVQKTVVQPKQTATEIGKTVIMRMVTKILFGI